MRNKDSGRFLVLDGMRGVAALGVLAFHVVVVTRFGQLDSLYLLVDFFFVLSGFVLLPSMPQAVSELPRVGLSFVVKRIFRFWPMLLVAVALTWFLFTHERDYGYENYKRELFIQSLLLLQIWFSATIAMNWPLWSLSAEWFANLVFTPLTAFKSAGIVLGVIAGYVALWYGLNVDHHFIGNSRSLGNGPIREWEAFGRALLGMGLGLLVRKHLEWLKRFRSLWLFICALVLTGLVFWSHSELQGAQVYWTTYFAAPVFSFLILQASQFTVHSDKPFGKFLGFLGRMSFGIYALHVVISLYYDKLVDRPLGREIAGPEWANYLVTKIFIVAAVSFVLAYAANWLVEKPLQKVGKTLVSLISKNSNKPKEN